MTSVCVGQTIEQKYDKMLTELFPQNAPGGTALVSKNGRVVYKKAFGKADLEWDIDMKTDHVFMIGSISKQITACAILKLAAQGKLSLSDSINKHLGDFPAYANTVTIEHLLTHTSGIVTDNSVKTYDAKAWVQDFTPAQLIDLFKNEPIRFAAGERYEYNNVGYMILAYIVEKVSGKSFAEYLRETFFLQLGMKNSHVLGDRKLVRNRVRGYERNKSGGYLNAEYLAPGHYFGAGGILSTVEDLSIWYNSVAGGKVISSGMLEMARKPFRLNNGQFTRYGYGWHLKNIQGSPAIEHGGLTVGFSAISLFLTDEKVGVYILANTELFRFRNAHYRAAALTIGKPYVSKAIRLPENVLRDYEGVFETDDGRRRIVRVVNGKLHTMRSDGGLVPVLPFQRDKFFFDRTLGRLWFERNKSGAITAVVSNNVDSTIFWKRTGIDLKSIEFSVAIGDLKKYAGRYRITADAFVNFFIENGRFYSQMTGDRKYLLNAIKKHRFYLVGRDVQFRFNLNEKGEVVSVTRLTRGSTYSRVD